MLAVSSSTDSPALSPPNPYQDFKTVNTFKNPLKMDVFWRDFSAFKLNVILGRCIKSQYSFMIPLVFRIF